MAMFYNPKHWGDDTSKLERLEKETKLVMQMATLVKHDLTTKATHRSLRSEKFISLLNTQNVLLIANFKNKDQDINLRISKLVVKKRYVMYLLFSIFEYEPLIAQQYEDKLHELEQLALDDMNDWMEILDLLETLKNPMYLEK